MGRRWNAAPSLGFPVLSSPLFAIPEKGLGLSVNKGEYPRSVGKEGSLLKIGPSPTKGRLKVLSVKLMGQGTKDIHL